MEHEDDEDPGQSLFIYVFDEADCDDVSLIILFFFLVSVNWIVDIIPGINPDEQGGLNSAQRRDPDALPPQTSFGIALNMVHDLFTGLGRGNAVFALKAGMLSGK